MLLRAEFMSLTRLTLVLLASSGPLFAQSPLAQRWGSPPSSPALKSAPFKTASVVGPAATPDPPPIRVSPLVALADPTKYIANQQDEEHNHGLKVALDVMSAAPASP